MPQYWDKEIETAPRYQMEALQSYRLSATVKRVYENVPHYRAKMDEAGIKPEDIKSLADLSKLPFTYKQDLRDTYPYGLFAVPAEEVVRIHASSGTTGKQIVVGYTQHDLDIWSDCTARALTAIGGSKSDFIHVSYGYGLFTGGLGIHYGVENRRNRNSCFYRQHQTTNPGNERFRLYYSLLYPLLCVVFGRNLKRNGVDTR